MRQNYQISEQFPSSDEEERLGFSVFARKEYWLLHLSEEKLLPITIRNHDNEIIAFYCFYVSKNRLITPFNAPFFTPYFIDNNIDSLLFFEVIEYCKQQYNYPIQCTLKSDLSLQKLQNSSISFKFLEVEMGTQLTVSKDSFIRKIEKKRKRRKLKTILSENIFEVREVSIRQWEKVYRQNLRWRKEKGHQNFMSQEEMVKAKNKFPQLYFAFQLQKDEKLLGTAFFLKVDENRIYVYSLITAPSNDSEEPSLLLWKAIYDWAQSNSISTIDMGTSMLAGGRINKSLARYKQFIGGSPYKKYRFEC